MVQDGRFCREDLGEVDKIRVINDSISTDIATSLASIDYYNPSIVLITGINNIDSSIKDYANQIIAKVSYVVLIGKEALALGQTLLQREYVCFSYASDMMQALMMAYQHSKLLIEDNRDSVAILFSPAGDLADTYENPDLRGEAFTTCVNELKEKLEKK